MIYIENNSLNNGHIIEVTPEMFEKAANDFSEGNEILKELLKFCFENNIKTTSCCSGHNGNKRPYVQFEFDDNNMKAILKMLKQLSLDDAISNFAFTKQPGVTSSFLVSMENDKYNEGFEQILEALKCEKEIEIDDIEQRRQLIVKSMKNHNVLNSYLEIQEENDSIAIGVGDEYLEIFPDEQKTIQWTEGTQLAEYSKDSSEVDSTLRKLESKTKNIEYLKEHPYDSKKINELWNNRDNFSTMEMNAAATMERNYEYGEKNVAVINVLPGSSIESVANEIMQLHQYGQACIVNFNSFVIDSRDYSNPDDIVQAYMQDYQKNKIERESKNKNESNNVTIESSGDSTLDVKKYDINNHSTEEINSSVKEKQKTIVELEYDEEYEQNRVNLESIRGINRSRRRDNLNEGINERLDKIEKALEDGQFISEEDWKFAVRHGGGPYQRTGGGDFRRIDIMKAKEANHFTTRKYIEDEKYNAIKNQKRIKDLENNLLDNLENQIYAGDYNKERFTKVTETIKNLRDLSYNLPQVDTESVKQPNLRTDEEIANNDRQLDVLKNELQLENDAYENELKQIEMATKEVKKSEIDSEISAIRTEITKEKDISKQEER